MNQLTARQRRVLSLYTNLCNVFRHEDEMEQIERMEGELDETYFTDLLRAFHLHFNQLTKNDVDLIDFIGLLNKLAFQHLLDENGEGGESEC